VVSGLPEALLALARLRLQEAAVLLPVFPALAPAPAVWSERLSAEAVQTVLRQAGSEASAQPAVARQPEEPAARDAVVAARGAAEVPQRAAEAPGAAPGPQQAVQDAAAAQDAEVLQPGVPGALAELLSGGLPSAAVWAFRRDQALPWPEPQPLARFAPAMACLQIAAPSERWWQAATNEVLS
jgi:hypothetical protein